MAPKRKLDAESDKEEEKKAKKVKESKEAGQENQNEAEKAASEEKKKSRPHKKRKRAVWRQMVKQMEFYFSDANLAKSAFMKELLGFDAGGQADLEVFLKFNKLAAIMKEGCGRVDSEDLWKALDKLGSELVGVKQDVESGKRLVFRKKPFRPLDAATEEARTLYVEGLEANVTHEALEKAFSAFGPVAYVSLPRFSSGGAKGFAFIEFKEEIGADTALKGPSAVDETSAREKVVPDELASIKAFQKERREEETDQNEEGGMSDQNGDDKTVKKKKRPRKKKKKNKKDDLTNGGHGDVVDLSRLTVMAKRTWKRLRNTYLNEQKKNMSRAKKFLREGEQEEYQEEEVEEEELPKEKSKKDLDLTRGTVVKFELPSPLEDNEALNAMKKRVRAAFLDAVKYVDMNILEKTYHVRCGSPEQAQRLAQVATFGDAHVLAGEEEDAYFDHAREARKAKLGGKVKLDSDSKKRGKEKLSEKIREEKRSTHKYFSDD